MGTSPILSTLSFRISKLVMLMIIQEGRSMPALSALSRALLRCDAKQRFHFGVVMITCTKESSKLPSLHLAARKRQYM
jgi:hypothetical protein